MEISSKDWWESEQKGLKHRNHAAMGPKHGNGMLDPLSVTFAKDVKTFGFFSEKDEQSAVKSIEEEYSSLVERFPKLKSINNLSQLNLVNSSSIGKSDEFVHVRSHMYVSGSEDDGNSHSFMSTTGMNSFNFKTGESVITLSRGPGNLSFDTQDNLILGSDNVATSAKAIFRHEFGHHYMNINLGKPGVLTEFTKEINNQLIGMTDGEARKISDYATTRGNELFAESFAVYTHRDYKKGMLPNKIESFLDKWVGGKEKKEYGLSNIKHLAGTHDQMTHGHEGSSSSLLGSSPFGHGVLNLTLEQLADSKRVNEKMDSSVFNISKDFLEKYDQNPFLDVPKANKEFVQRQLSNAIKDHPYFTRADEQQGIELLEIYTKNEIAQWANTSGDTDIRSVGLQIVAKETFGLKEAILDHLGKNEVGENWVGESFDRVRTFEDANYNINEEIPLPTGNGTYTLKDLQSKFLQAQYDATQKYFKDAGIKEVVLYRGVEHFDGGKLRTEEVSLQPMSSFSTDAKFAINFAKIPGDPSEYMGLASHFGTLYASVVPVEKILSHPRTGFGCTNEKEVAVLGGKMKSTVVPTKIAMEVLATAKNIEMRDMKNPNFNDQFLSTLNKVVPEFRDKSLGLSSIFKGGPGSGIRGHRTLRQVTSKLTPKQQAEALVRLQAQSTQATSVGDQIKNEKWNDVSQQMDKNLKTIADGTAAHKSVDGIADTKHIKIIISNMRNEADLYTKYLASDTAVKLRDFTSTYENILHEGIRNGEFKNINAKDLDAFGIDSVKKMVHQEVESNRQQFTDHGIRHVYGNIERQLDIMDSMSAKVPVKDKLAALAIMVNHDMGYTTKGVRVGGLEGVKASSGHKDNSFEMYNSQKLTWNENKLFTAKEFDRVAYAIKTHDSTEMDKDPLLTSTRISDNLALFAKEKLPSMFKYVEGGQDYLIKMGAAAKKGNIKDFESLRNGLYRTIDSSSLNINLKRDLKAGTREINMMTPKFSMGVLAGEISDISGDKKGKVNVIVKYDAYDAFLQNHFDMGQKQTKKLLGDYGITDFSKTSYDIGGKLNVMVEGYSAPKKKEYGLGRIIKHRNHAAMGPKHGSKIEMAPEGTDRIEKYREEARDRIKE